MSDRPTEKAVLGRVDFTCSWCGGAFTYQPKLIGADLGVRLSVDRIGDECMRHTAQIVDMRTSPGQEPTDG